MQRRATCFIPQINKLDYQERLKKLDLPTLTYRQFRGSIIEIYKILHSLYDANCTNLLFELKEPNRRGYKFAVKTTWSKTSIRWIFFSLQIANLWNSLPENLVEAPNTDTFKNKFDRHCRERNLLFDVDIDYIIVIICTVCIAKAKEEIIFFKTKNILTFIYICRFYYLFYLLALLHCGFLQFEQ